jgi:MGT family glycosyltransferase
MESKSMKTKNGGKILFACVPADGHFNPLTGLAKHLQQSGYDVRWYTQDLYKGKLEKMGIPHYPFVNALQLNQENFEGYFADRVNHKSQVAKLKFDLEHIFIRQSVKTMEDIEAIYRQFPFDLLIADVFTFCAPMVKSRLGVPVMAVGVTPFMQNSRDLPPAGLGLTPSTGLVADLKRKLLHWVSGQFIFKKPTRLFRELLQEYGVTPGEGNLFDILYNEADILLQSGAPGFEYRRSDLNSNIRFAGPLLPYVSTGRAKPWFDNRLNKFERVVLVTQGTAEKDVNKIIVPALEAFRNSNTLVVCTTGGSQTLKLRTKYASENLIIEDYIPFNDVMPYADVYITNGGYGGVMLSIGNGLPMVVAGVHEGKNEICARVGYFKYGINLKTETPLPNQLRSAVEEVISNPMYKENVNRLQTEFSQYDPGIICEKEVAGLIQPRIHATRKETIYTERFY